MPLPTASLSQFRSLVAENELEILVRTISRRAGARPALNLRDSTVYTRCARAGRRVRCQKWFGPRSRVCAVAYEYSCTGTALSGHAGEDDLNGGGSAEIHAVAFNVAFIR